MNHVDIDTRIMKNEQTNVEKQVRKVVRLGLGGSMTTTINQPGVSISCLLFLQKDNANHIPKCLFASAIKNSWMVFHFGSKMVAELWWLGPTRGG